MGLYLAAALQIGPEKADANICAIARRWHIDVPAYCVPWIDTYAKIAVIAALVLCLSFLGYDVFLLLRRVRLNRPQNYSERYIGIMEAIWWIAEKSAWGHWQTALWALSGSLPDSVLLEASRQATKAGENGTLKISGRLKDSVEYKDIDHHFWRTVYIDVEPSPNALKKATVKPRDGVTARIPDYDDLHVERRTVETLWPRHDWKLHVRAFRLRIRAAIKNMTEPKSPSSEPRGTPPATTAASEEKPLTPVQPTLTIGPNAPKNWERLFAIGDEGRSVWLRFLPDTKRYRSDALVLIIYGQKVLRNRERLRVDAAHAAVNKSVQNAPYRPSDSSLLNAIAMFGRLQAVSTLDYVDECVPGYLERVGLSEGGFYQLTQDGERHAATLAYDLIRRA